MDAFVLFSSLMVLGQMFFIAQVLRFVSKYVIAGAALVIIDELLAFLQLSCCILEIGVLSNLYGYQSWQVITATFVMLTIKHVLFFKGGYIGNPTVFVEKYYEAKRKVTFSVTFAICITMAEMIGSLSAHPILRLLWGQSFSELHNREAFRECRSTLHVTFSTGFFVEILATFLSLSSDLITPNKIKPPVRALVTVLLSQIFQKTSGVWMNPVIASTHTFKCVGHGSSLEHFFVYWIGPFIGVMIVCEVKNGLSHLLKMHTRINLKTCLEVFKRVASPYFVHTQAKSHISDEPRKATISKKQKHLSHRNRRHRSNRKKTRGWS